MTGLECPKPHSCLDACYACNILAEVETSCGMSGNAKALNIVYNGMEIKQYAKRKYLGRILDQSISDESMALNIIDEVNLHLKFLTLF